MSNEIIIYTDGGCRGNGKETNIGAWACYMDWKGNIKELSGVEENTTNNIQELTGVIKALEAINNKSLPVIVFADSAYVVNGINEWVAGWKKKGWRKADKKPILNLELWKQLDSLVNLFDDISIRKVKGHSTDVGNNRADELVNIAMNEWEDAQ